MESMTQMEKCNYAMRQAGSELARVAKEYVNNGSIPKNHLLNAAVEFQTTEANIVKTMFGANELELFPCEYYAKIVCPTA